MTLFDIPVGFASVFLMILIGYFVLTVWFGSPQPVPVTQKPAVPKVPEKDEAPKEISA